MVWDDYGLQASNSSLNQYISILRRALSAFGCEELDNYCTEDGVQAKS